MRSVCTQWLSLDALSSRFLKDSDSHNHRRRPFVSIQRTGWLLISNFRAFAGDGGLAKSWLTQQ
jgi:hypothetical protein